MQLLDMAYWNVKNGAFSKDKNCSMQFLVHMAYSRSSHKQNKMPSKYRMVGSSQDKYFWNYPLGEALGTMWF